jgi:hypothetical protein
MMRILVTGDRKWSDYNMIKEQLERVFKSNPDMVVIQGGAKGADALAAVAGQVIGVRVLTWPADWKSYGRAAGPIRNQKMLDEGKPDVVFAFHDDINASRGTKDMLDRAKKAGIRCHLFFHKTKAIPSNWYLGDVSGKQIEE